MSAGGGESLWSLYCCIIDLSISRLCARLYERMGMGPLLPRPLDAAVDSTDSSAIYESKQ